MAEMVFQYLERAVGVELIRQHRSTIQIKIVPPCRMTARIPMRTTLKELQIFLETRRPEIERYLDRMMTYASKIPQYHFTEGELIQILGRDYRLTIESSLPGESLVGRVEPETQRIILFPKRKKSSSHKIREEQYPISDKFVYHTKEEISQTIEKTMMKFADHYLGEHVKNYAAQMGVTPSSIHIGKAKSRYGSCSSRGRLMFCWRILLAPEEIVEYLVVHELAHLIHLNHSKAFYDVLAVVLPSYKTSERWLKQNGALLVWP